MTGNGIAYTAQQERIQAKLADPRTADALERLLDKLDVVAFGVEAVDGFLRRSEQVADSLSASIRELKSLQTGDHTGADFVAAIPQLARAGTQVAAASRKPGFQNLLESGLIDQLGDPQTIANIQAVLSKTEVAAFALTAIDGFIRRGDEITDSVRDSLKDVRALAASIDFEKLKPVNELLDKLPALREGAAEFAEAGRAIKDSYEAAKSVPYKETSIWGMMRALKDPDVNRTVTLALEFAKQYGKRIA